MDQEFSHKGHRKLKPSSKGDTAGEKGSNVRDDSLEDLQDGVSVLAGGHRRARSSLGGNRK